MAQLPKVRRAGSWYSPKSIVQSVALRPKVYWAMLAGCSAALLLPSSLSSTIRASIALGFWTIFGVLSQAKEVEGAQKALFTALAAATVFLSWLVTHVVFTFHYAHEFYRPDDRSQRLAGGLEFAKEDKPDYWDFFYFATTIGAASQTSDVAVRTKALRRLVTLHAIVSFVFNTTLLALAINIGASLI